MKHDDKYFVIIKRAIIKTYIPVRRYVAVSDACFFLHLAHDAVQLVYSHWLCSEPSFLELVSSGQEEGRVCHLHLFRTMVSEHLVQVDRTALLVFRHGQDYS